MPRQVVAGGKACRDSWLQLKLQGLVLQGKSVQVAMLGGAAHVLQSWCMQERTVAVWPALRPGDASQVLYESCHRSCARMHVVSAWRCQEARWTRAALTFNSDLARQHAWNRDVVASL